MALKDDCYGTMFPDLERLDANAPLAGKAFEVLVESHLIGIASRQVKVRPDGWAECANCERYRDCYDLSMAKLALAMALRIRV